MNRTVPRKHITLSCSGLAAAALGLILSVAGVMPANAAGTPQTTTSATGPAFLPDTIHRIQVSPSLNSRRAKIRLYPDAGQQVLFFSANGQDGKVYQLYVFDMYGKLVHQTSIRNKETTVLTDITQGDYLFEVFSDDDRIGSGRLTVK